MKRNGFQAVASLSFTLILMMGAWQAQAQDTKTPYPSMAPLDQYLKRIETLRLPWHGARLQRPYHATPQLWSSEGMVMKLRSKARTALSAW